MGILAVETIQKKRAITNYETVIRELLVKVHEETLVRESIRTEETRNMELAALWLSSTHILNNRKRPGKSKYKEELVQDSTCTEVGGGFPTKRRSSENGSGPWSATLQSGPSTSSSSVLGGKFDHAEVPCAKRCPVNVQKETKDDKGWSWGAAKRFPGSKANPGKRQLVVMRRQHEKNKFELMDKEGINRSEHEQNTGPQLEVKKVKGLVLPQPPRLLRKGRGRPPLGTQIRVNNPSEFSWKPPWEFNSTICSPQ